MVCCVLFEWVCLCVRTIMAVCHGELSLTQYNAQNLILTSWECVFMKGLAVFSVRGIVGPVNNCVHAMVAEVVAVV